MHGALPDRRERVHYMVAQCNTATALSPSLRHNLSRLVKARIVSIARV